MRRMAWLAVALITILLPRTAQAQEKDGFSLMGFIDSLQLGWRPEPRETEPFNQPIAMNGNCILNYYQTDAVILHRSAGSFGGDMDWSVGPRLILGRGMSDRDAFEIGYFAQYQMNGSFFNAGGTPLNQRADYRSEVNSFEINCRHWFLPEFSVLAGFRYINWHEDLNAAFDTAAGSVNTIDHTNNNLFGGQIGGDWKHSYGNGFGLEIGGKAGIYGNRSESDGTLGTAGSTRASFVGELGLVGTYNLTNYLKARAGYQVMWVEGITLAPDQISVPGINNRGGVFLHGAVVGLDLQW